MQPNSIPEPLCSANERNTPPFPSCGDNFTTVIPLPMGTDALSLLEAIDFLQDCQVAMTAFEQASGRTCTQKTGI